MGVTNRWHLPFPEDDDTPDVPRDVKLLAEAVDDVGKDSQGLLADRPVSGKAGRYFFATDTSTLYRDDGTTWHPFSTGGISRVSSLPASPADGQEVFYQSTSMATENIIWKFRYRSSSTGPYRWEFQGGAHWQIRDDTTRAVPATTSAPIGTAQINVPLAGDYLCSLTGIGTGATPTNQLNTSLYADSTYTGIYCALTIVAANAAIPFTLEGKMTATVANALLAPRHSIGAGNTGSVYFRVFKAIPICVG